MHSYARLRLYATTVDLSPLLDPRPAPDDSPIDTSRVVLMACAFLRFNCDYGDLIRWLEGPYTDAHRDWAETFANLETVKDEEPPPDFPSPDYERTFRSCTEGVPLKATLYSDLNSCVLRNIAPLSRDLIDNEADVDESLRKEEKLSYHIILPRFLWRFFPGLFLSIFRVAYRFGDPKPRLCVDPSTTISPNDIGNVNSLIPKPGIDEDENPTIYYGTAFIRYLIWIWNLRITYPNEDILQIADDISAAFHRILYHPDLAPAFATVWKQFLIIPVSAIFGSRSSPGNYMWKGELRSHYANFMEVPAEAFQEPLITRLRLPPPPSADEISRFQHAVPDSKNPGIRFSARGVPERRHPSFVDDTGVAHVRSHFLTAVAASVHAAYVMFGHPLDDPMRPPCINPIKWKEDVLHTLEFLGYHIDTRTMTVSWPLAKRSKLRLFLDMLLGDADTRSRSTPHGVSRVLGLIRHAAPVAPMGTFRSLRLQHLFNDILAKAPSIKTLRRWYQRKVIILPPSIRQELHVFRSKISDDITDPFWCRPIGLMVPREPTIVVYTDASTKALGGYSLDSDLNHMWRITVDDLRAAGLPSGMAWNNKQNYHEEALDPMGLHINILEFIAIIIELWICLRQLHAARHSSSPPNSEEPAATDPPGGHRLLARADNTSALSWLRYATRTKRPKVRFLARLLTAFLSHPFAAPFVLVQGLHLAGTANVNADHLSRPELSESWAAVMENCVQLRNLRVCLLPPELLSLLVSAFLKEQTEEWYETAMTRLWTIAPPVFVTGSQRPVGTSTSVA